MSDRPSADPNAMAEAFLSQFGGAGAMMPDPIGGLAPPPLAPGSPRANEQLSSGVPSVIYRDGDDYTYLEAMPLEVRTRLQDQLVSLGLASNVIRGELDNATVGGLAKVMALANRSGTSWKATLNRLSKLQADGHLGGGGGGGRALPAYLPPDPAALAQTVKRTLRDELGRDPQQDELDSLSAELSTYARQAYDAQIAAAQGASTTDVDPQARFAELVESKYANELQMIDDREDQALVTATSKQQMGFVDRVLGAM